jgi:hypothetical protein
MEGILHATGIDGKACLLRTICEMQSNPIGEFTVVGEIITILLRLLRLFLIQIKLNPLIISNSIQAKKRHKRFLARLYRG